MAEQRIRFVRAELRAMFPDDEANLIIIGGAIATPARYARFAESLCHLSADGVIRRYGREIGHASDIEYLRGDRWVAGQVPGHKPNCDVNCGLDCDCGSSVPAGVILDAGEPK